MPERPWYPMNPSDYLANTTSLSVEEHGFYHLMLHHLWINDGVLPADLRELSAILCVDFRKTSRLMSGRLRRHFLITSSQITNKRLSRELQKAIDISNKRKESGKKGGKANASHGGEHNQQPTTNNQPKEDDITSTSDELDFSVFWSGYPRKENKKKSEVAWKNLTKTKKRKALKDITTRFKDVERKYIPLPTTYIHGERWDDELPSTAPVEADPWKELVNRGKAVGVEWKGAAYHSQGEFRREVEEAECARS